MIEVEQQILDRIRLNLKDHQLEGSIVYFDDKIVQAGANVQVGDLHFEVPWNANLAFVDLEPGANWGHACCYMAIRQDADNVIKLTAQMPPFLKSDNSTFRLLWRGPRAPEWAVGP